MVDFTVDISEPCLRSGKLLNCNLKNIYGLEFDDELSKNDTRICILFNTPGRTQKQTRCLYYFVLTSKTTVSVRLKLKRQKKPVAYYHTSSAARRLILRGDIEQNPPGPIQERNTTSKPAAQRTKIKVKCPNCTKTAQSNHKRFSCTVCFDLYHAKCTNLTGNRWKNVRADKR